jgi:hypothetical protein
VLTEGNGGPLAVVAAPANRHSLLLPDGLERVVVEPPCPLRDLDQHLYLDKAFDGEPRRRGCSGTSRTCGGSARRSSTPAPARRNTPRGGGSWSGRFRG